MQTQLKSVFQIPTSITEQVEAAMNGRRGWSGPIGMTMTQGTPEGGQGDGGGGDGSGGAAGAGSILDAEADLGEGGDGSGAGDGAGGDGGQDAGAGSGQAFDPAAFSQQMEDLISRRLDSAINTISRRLGGQSGQGGGQGGGGEGGSGGQGGGGNGGEGGTGDGGGQQQNQPTGPSSADVREARMTYRDYVGGEMKFLGNEERDFAQVLANGLLREALGRGDDPETAGTAVAKEVAKQIKGLRSHYEGKVLAGLRRNGTIPATGPATAGQPLPGSGTPGDASGFKKGQDRAAQRHASRLPQQ